MNILDVNELSVEYTTPRGAVDAVSSVSFGLQKGETIGMVGESGCGKSTFGLSILRLLPPAGHITSGRVLYNNTDLVTADEITLRKVRGREISMVFQDPSATLNPLMRIRDHFLELYAAHEPSLSKSDAASKAGDLLLQLGIPSERLEDYPHQLSGGMKQRVCIGLAIALTPRILIADEPTTALDVLVEAQILQLLKRLKEDLNLTLTLITHNMGVVAETADRIVVMYAGKLVEVGDTRSIFRNALHPYTEALLHSVPNLRNRKQNIMSIPGNPPDLVDPPKGCLFSPRCPHVFERCQVKHPPLVSLGNGRQVACYLRGG
jgi:oligopeptide/dipeptide ABC transporter ATP-binding protein